MTKVDIQARRNREGKRTITLEQRQKIQTATNKAHRIIRAMGRDMDSIWAQSGRPSKRWRKRRQAWRDNSRFVRWFGSSKLRRLTMRRTRARIRRLRREFDSGVRFSIIPCQTGRRSFLCNPERVAYCSPGTRIKLCPSFFDKSPERQAAVIIHELCHKNGMIHRQEATNRNKALKLAVDRPILARKNPENYEQIAYEYPGA